jgi:cytoskeletal protein CcmA (bactofilin family)
MFENRKDEYIPVSNGTGETIVGTSVKLKGNLKSDGDITIDGSINGEIKTKGTITVGPNANIIGNIKAKEVNISGTVQGNIHTTERLNINETGRVFGDVCTNILTILAGAVFTGKSTMVENIKQAEIEPVFEAEEAEEKEELKEEAKK